MKRQSIVIGGRPRQYLLAAAGQPRSLVIFLHGKGGTAAWADGETGWSILASQEGFALALPEGLPPDPASSPRFLLNPPTWNDGGLLLPTPSGGIRGEETETPTPPNPVPKGEGNKRVEYEGAAPEIDDVSFIDAVIDDASAQLDIIFDRVFLSGFSNGAGMTFRFAAERAGRVAAIAPIAGHCWLPHPQPGQPIPTLYMIGTNDPLIPLRGGMVRSPWSHRLIPRPSVVDTLERWAMAVGCEPIPTTTSENDRVRTDLYPGPVPFRSLTIEGLGHHWPGGKGRLNPRIAGPPSDAVNGTRVVWEFFRAFQL